ncbi:hypothetical protein [Gimesia chilikensis]
MECLPDDEHPKGLGRCGIYQNRPQTCRCFPAKLNASNELAILYDIPSNGRDGEPAYDLCSRQWTASDLDPNDTIQSLVIARYEMTFFSKIAMIWNQAPGAWNQFPDFIDRIYSNRIASETQEDTSADTVGVSDNSESHKRAA